MQKIGIFGGCFNPPHKMHENIANILITMKKIDKVIFVPTGNRYNKKGLTDVQNRINMLQLVIGKDNNFEVSSISKQEKYTYTYQVLDYYKSKMPESDIYFICGTDNLKEFKTWKQYEYILRNYKLLVITRDKENTDKLLKEYSKYIDRICIVDMGFNPVSSTQIRNCIKTMQYDKIRDVIDDKVLKYIIDNNLYYDI